jgi:DNA-directed RNA polymerase subunit RPC12/RpoP
MGTTAQLTATKHTAIMTITLPEILHDLPYESEDYWKCPGCGSVDYYENWNSVGYYDIPNFIMHLEQLDDDELKVGEELDRHGRLFLMLRQDVTEHSKYKCDNCGNLYDQDDLGTAPYWNCVNCGEGWDNCHDALTCCPGECTIDQCTHREGIKTLADDQGKYHPLRGEQLSKTFFKCYCTGDENRPCGRYVCVVCHAYVYNEVEVAAHVCPGLQSPTPVFTDGTQVGPDCFCEAGFCCHLHDRHTRSHPLLCWSA